MACRLLAPASRLGVSGERLGVGPLCPENGEEGRIAAEVRAVFAYVRVRARTLGNGPQAVAAGQTGLDEWGGPPVGVELDGDGFGEDGPR